MKERPILFSPLMVRALLAGTKTQTRRIIKPVRGFEHHNICKIGMPYAFDPWAVWWHGNETDRVGCLQECRYGKPQDQLWVREQFRLETICEDIPPRNAGVNATIQYESDGTIRGEQIDAFGRLRVGMFMPRSASRMDLLINQVRAQKLNDISEDDAMAEGITEPEPAHGEWCDPALGREGHWSYRKAYKTLWESINGDGSWALNPPVWAISFTRIV